VLDRIEEAGYTADMLNRVRQAVRHLSGETRRQTRAADEWRARHPDATYGHYFAEQMVSVIAQDASQKTIGRRITDHSARMGAHIANEFIGMGMERGDVVVDYGCGTLRVGRHLIDYLDTGRFVGLDLDRQIVAAAEALLGDEQRAKRPLLEEIGPETLKRVADMSPRWVVCNAVVNHLAPEDYDAFFDAITQLMGSAGARLVIRTRYREPGRRVGATNWDVGPHDLQTAAARHGLSMSLPGGYPPRMRWGVALFASD
jgi:SAM-dependent methyltransferase